MKKGFTLIELLAVLVVIAIISVIAIPTLINVISKAKINALKDSAYGIIDAGNLYAAQNQIEQDILFNISNNTTSSEQTNKMLKYKGNVKNGIVVVMTSSKVALCIDDGKNYALKLENDTTVKTGIGTCEEYEAENGKFTVTTPIEELRKEYEKQLEDQEKEYESRVSELEEQLSNVKVKYIGSYGGNTVIDVSGYKATSIDKFIVKPTGNQSVGKNVDFPTWANVKNTVGYAGVTMPSISVNATQDGIITRINVYVGTLTVTPQCAGYSGSASATIGAAVYYAG